MVVCGMPACGQAVGCGVCRSSGAGVNVPPNNFFVLFAHILILSYVYLYLYLYIVYSNIHTAPAVLLLLFVICVSVCSELRRHMRVRRAHLLYKKAHNTSIHILILPSCCPHTPLPPPLLLLNYSYYSHSYNSLCSHIKEDRRVPASTGLFLASRPACCSCCAKR